jgi:RHS repeat-associated protein
MTRMMSPYTRVSVNFVNQLPLAALCAALLLVASPASGQVGTGITPFASMAPSTFDQVNMGSGNVFFSVPVVNKRGQGMPFTYSLVYNNSIWTPSSVSGTNTWTPAQGWGWGGAGSSSANYVSPTVGNVSYTWSQGSCLDPGSGQEDYWDIYQFNDYFDSTGAYHVLDLQLSDWSNYGYACGSGQPVDGGVNVFDGSGFYLISLSAGPDGPEAEIYTPSGILMSPNYIDNPNLGSFVLDAYGDKISINYAGTTFTDTLGATALTITPGTTSSTYAYTGPDGNSHNYTVNYTSYTVRTNFGCSGVVEYGPTSQYLVSSIKLPDTTSYSFTYEATPSYSADVTGRLASVKLPTGGTISYKYSGGSNGITCADGSTPTLERTTPDTGSNYWTYARTESGGDWSTTVTDPSGNQTALSFYAWGTYDPFPVETERKVYQGTTSGTLMETVDTCYNGASIPCVTTPINSAISSRMVQVTLPNLSPSQTNTIFDVSTYSLPVEVDEYNFGPTLVRKTLTQYAPYIYGQTDQPVYDAPEEIQIEDSTGTVKAQTQYTYNSSLEPVQETLSTTGSSTIVRSFGYGSSGILTSQSDFNSNTTHYASFTCGSNGAFPQTANMPLSLSASTSWNCYTGLPNSVTDVNGNPTTFTYDIMGRLIKTVYPDTGQVGITYNDTSTPPNIVTTTKLSSSQNRVDTTTLDGLGRVSQTELNSDPTNPTMVNKTYDALGRVGSVTNPFRSTSDPTYGVTSYSYDPLNRLSGSSAITRPDSNKVGVSYSVSSTYGLCATSTDEASTVRTTCTDALGRVTSVTEDPSGKNYQTTYTYDVLNDLTGVSQGGQTRTYTYDMLSRLTSATTPEAAGNTRYFYYTTSGGALCSGNPNAVCRVTDERGITTTYTYDALNRLTSKTYSDSTPTANFYYDEANLTLNGTQYTLANTKGRLSHTSAASGTALTIHSYDSMGRTLDIWQCTPYNCSNSTIWNVQYTYDQGGDVTSWTNASETTFTNTISTAQRITEITSSLSDSSSHPGTLASNITYDPAGQLATLLNGCVGSGCVQRQETYAYNNRLQPVQIQLGASGGSSDANFCQVYNYYGSGYNASSCTTPSQATTGNNGSVMGEYFLDNTNTSLGYTSTFTYDTLSRLMTAVATGNSTYNLTFETSTQGYDRWGNMTCITNAQTNGPCPSFSYNTSANQISNTNYTYDAAGNLTQDGTGTGTHTYQWDAEGRLKSLDYSTSCSTATACYTYNALGERAEAQVGSTYREYVYDPSGTVTGWSERGSSFYLEYLFLDGRRMGSYQNSDTYFAHGDMLGTIGTLTNHAGTTIQDVTYYPWGQQWKLVGSLDDNRFASLDYLDSESDLNPTSFRMFSSGKGRWMSPDLLAGDVYNPQSLNRYPYALNSPCSLADPLGLAPCNFNIAIINAANLTGQDLTAIENQIKAIFQQSSEDQPNSVGVIFANGGTADYTLTYNNNGVPGSNEGGYNSAFWFFGWHYASQGYVFANLVQPGQYYDRTLGVGGAHEMGHGLAHVGDVNYNSQVGSTLMSIDTDPTYNLPTDQSPLYSPNFPTGLLFTAKQVAALFSNCHGKHPNGNPARLGGGGDAGGSSSFIGFPVMIWTGPYGIEGGYDYLTIYWIGGWGPPIQPQRK